MLVLLRVIWAVLMRVLKQSEQVQVALLGAVQMPQMGQILVPQVVVLEVPDLHFGRFYRVLLSVSESNPC